MLAAVVLALTAAASASADVLVRALPASIPCGADIEMGVWYQAYSGGPRWAKLSVKTLSGKTLLRRKVKATTRWKTYRYAPRCARTYVVTYQLPGGFANRYRVRVRG